MFALKIRMTDNADVTVNEDGTADVLIKFSNEIDANAARPPIAGNFSHSTANNVDRFNTEVISL